jgi:hypothetical protein
MPSLLRSSLTPAHRLARVLELPSTSAARTSHLAVRGSTAPRGSSGLEMSSCPPRSADRTVCDGLARPPAACLATVRGARVRCVRPTSAFHCFDYEHSRRIRSQHLFETCASPLRPRACALDDGDWGTWRFTTPDPLRRAASGSHAAFFFRALPRPTVPLTSLSPPRGSHLAYAKREVRRVGRDRALQAFREDPPTTTIRDAFHRQPTAPCAGRTHLENGHVRFPLRVWVPVSLRPRLRTLVRGATS